jgi:LPXTG-motif cell wall-anchored protein
MTSPPRFSPRMGGRPPAIGEILGKIGVRDRYVSCWVDSAMSKRRSLLFTFAVVLPAAAVLAIAPSRAQAQVDMGATDGGDAAGDMAATEGGTDAAGDAATTDTGGATDAATTDAPRDTAGNDTAASDAPRADGGTTPTDDEGDCGCRLGSTGRSSAALPLAGALAGLGLVIRRRRRR